MFIAHPAAATAASPGVSRASIPQQEALHHTPTNSHTASIRFIPATFFNPFVDSFCSSSMPEQPRRFVRDG